MLAGKGGRGVIRAPAPPRKFRFQKREFYEQEMFKGVYWFKLDDAIKVMTQKGTSGVAKLVKEREVPILKLSKLFI